MIKNVHHLIHIFQYSSAVEMTLHMLQKDINMLKNSLLFFQSYLHI